MLTFPRLEILRAELTFLQLNKVPEQYMAVLSDQAVSVYEEFATEVLKRKELQSVCEFDELRTAFNNSCSFRHMFRNFCELNYSGAFEQFLTSFVFSVFKPELYEFRLLDNKQAKQYETRFIYYEDDKIDRVKSFGVLELLALILDCDNLYNEDSVLEAKEMQETQLLLKSKAPAVDQTDNQDEEAEGKQDQDAQSLEQLQERYSEMKPLVKRKLNTSSVAENEATPSADVLSPQIFGEVARENEVEKREKLISLEQKQIQELTDKNYQSDAEIAELRSDIISEKLSFETQLAQALKSSQKAKEANESLTQSQALEESNLNEEITRLENVIEEMTDEFELSEQKTIEIEQVLEKQKQKDNEMERQINFEKEQKKGLENEFKEFKEQAQLKLEKLDELIERENIIIEELQARPKPSEISETAQFVIDDLESQMERAKDECYKAKMILEEAEVRAGDFQEENENLLDRIAELEAENEELKHINAELLQDLQNLVQK